MADARAIRARPRVAVTGPWLLPGWDDGLSAAGCEVICGPSIDEAPSTPLSEDELNRLCSGADAILVSTREQITSAALDAAPNLKIVAKATIGVERIDLDAATERDVLVVNSPAPENIIGLAEATVGIVAALAKRLIEKESRVRGGGWRDASTDGLVLAGRTLGIIGLGRVGGAVARRLQGWDMRLIGFDPYITEVQFAALGVVHVGWQQLFRDADVVTIHVPLTAETSGFVGRDELATMRSGAFLVNTSRGRVLDEAAVVAALETEHLGGVALDVFAEEPLRADSPLRGIPRERLLLTPHSIGSSHASRGTGTRMAVEAILAALDGRVPENVVNPESISGWLSKWVTA